MIKKLMTLIIITLAVTITLIATALLRINPLINTSNETLNVINETRTIINESIASNFQTTDYFTQIFNKLHTAYITNQEFSYAQGTNTDYVINRGNNTGKTITVFNGAIQETAFTNDDISCPNGYTRTQGMIQSTLKLECINNQTIITTRDNITHQSFIKCSNLNQSITNTYPAITCTSQKITNTIILNDNNFHLIHQASINQDLIEILAWYLIQYPLITP